MPGTELQDKTAIVTGGGNGIGRGIALAYAQAGAHVVVASRNQEHLDEVAGEITALGRESMAIRTDVCNVDMVANLVGSTVDRFGRLDILVNNAGVGDTLRVGKPEDLPVEGWRATIDLNLTGTFICSIEAGKVMIRQQHGKIVNISSVVSRYANGHMPDYSAAKAGVNSLTASLAYAWADHNINVNAIVAGAIVTEKHHTQVKREREDGSPIPPLKLPGDIADVASLAVFLGSDQSKHISGEALGLMGVNRN
jgi:NAD(P)-dependent dehydrogenase (short-subunit alcohol dehydrogenase family)